MNRGRAIVVAREELREVWHRGWGLAVLLGVATVMSVAAVAMAYTAQINLLDAKEGLVVVVKVTLAASLALVMFASADSISGERDRLSLESILLTPVRGRELVFGKMAAAWTWWIAIFLISIPYLVVLGTSLGLRLRALVAALVLGVIFSVLLAVWGAALSVRSSSNKSSLGVGLLALLILAVPGQIPGAVMGGPIGSAIKAIDPITAGLEFLDRFLVAEASASQVFPWLIGPFVWILVSAGLLYRWSETIELEPGQ